MDKGESGPCVLDEEVGVFDRVDVATSRGWL
jgi:hypothetical protein